MKPMLKKLRKKIAEWIYPIDIVLLTRKQYHGIDHRALLYFDTLDESDQVSLMAEAYRIVQEKKIQNLADRLIQEQVEMSIKQARNMEEVNYGRATINGIALFIQELERLATVYESQYLRTDVFNKFDIL